MRYAILSDIHGNLEAFHAVLDTLSKDDIDAYLSIGDIVGYGADPAACIKLLKSLHPASLVAGNHEWGVLGLTDIEYFNETAKTAIVWTKGVLAEDELEYLKSFRLVYEKDDFALVHGTLNSPEKFNYIFDSYEAIPTFNMMKKKICFVGHTHAPCIFYQYDDKLGYEVELKIRLGEGRRYIVNVGSIGQPRDRDPRASYAVYDSKENSVEIKRVAYDTKTAQGKIVKAGLPEELAVRLEEGI